MARGFVALGGNLGDVLQSFREALQRFAPAGIHVARVSPALRTVALTTSGTSRDAPDYWNAVVEIYTEATPEVLLAHLLRIELELGRERTDRWGSRTLDLDLLLLGELRLSTPTLTVPHPRLAERVFVLWPLCEIDPDVQVPGTGATAGELLAKFVPKDQGILYRLTNWHPGSGFREVSAVRR